MKVEGKEKIQGTTKGTKQNMPNNAHSVFSTSDIYMYAERGSSVTNYTYACLHTHTRAIYIKSNISYILLDFLQVPIFMSVIYIITLLYDLYERSVS